jgi:hypothetical protein
MSNSDIKLNSTEERALHLLGQGIPPESVAAACGVTPSRISQLLSDEHFIAQVAEKRFANLEKHNITDNKYDTLENVLLDRLKDCVPLLGMDPMKLSRVLSIVNAAKRRGVSAPEQVTQQQTVVQLIMPNVIMQKFTTNIANQVIQAGEQTLQTIPSHMLAGMYATSSNLNIACSPEVQTPAASPTQHPQVTKELAYVNQALDSAFSGIEK